MNDARTEPKPHPDGHHLRDVLPPKPQWRGVLHRSAFFVALGLAPGLVFNAPDAGTKVAMAIYALALMGLFGVSGLLHRLDWSERGRTVMSRLDHSMIFVFIAATYTPITLVAVEGAVQKIVLTAVWGAAVIGGLAQFVQISPPRWFTSLAYIGVGWIAVLVVPSLLDRMGIGGFLLVLAGGLAYTAGGVVYARKRPDPAPEVFGFHEVFHGCTLLGALLHLWAIVFYALPLA